MSISAPRVSRNTAIAPTLPRLPLQRLAWVVVALAVGAAVVIAPITWLAVGAVGAGIIFSLVAHPIGALGLLLIIAPIRTLYATEAPRLGLPQIPLDFGQWLVLAFLASWLLNQVRRRQFATALFSNRGYRELHVLIPLLTFVLAAGVSAFSAQSLTSWLTEWFKWLQMAAIAIVIVDLCVAGHRNSVVVLVIIAGAANAVIGVYQYFGGSGALHLLINENNFRAFGTFGQPNPFGGFMGITFPLAFAGFLAALHSTIRVVAQRAVPTAQEAIPQLVLFGAGASVIAAGLIMSWSRGAWLGFALSLGVMLFALPRKTSHQMLLTGAIVIIVGLLSASGRLPTAITARLSTITEDIFNVQDVRGVDITPANYAVVERLAHWQAAVNMAENHPWIGVGLGNYEIAYAEYRLANWKFPLGHAHNTYLNMLAETGVLGLTTYLSFLFAVLWYSWRVRRHPDFQARAIAIGILGVWTYLIVHSLTDNLYVNNVFIHLGVTIGILASLVREIPQIASRLR